MQGQSLEGESAHRDGRGLVTPRAIPPIAPASEKQFSGLSQNSRPGLPEQARLVIEHLEGLLSRISLSPEAATEIREALLRRGPQAEGALSAEAALLVAVAKESPEVQKLSDWLTSASVPGVPVPLHPAAFALVGMLYFFAQVVSRDPAVATRTIEAFAIQSGGKGQSQEAIADELEERYRQILMALAKDTRSCFGALLNQELTDKSSSTQSHFLAGILTPMFRQMSLGTSPVSASFIERVFFDREVPKCVTDLGLLEKIEIRHVELMREVAGEYLAAVNLETGAAKERRNQEDAVRMREKQKAERAAARTKEREQNEEPIVRVLEWLPESKEAVGEVSPRVASVLRQLFGAVRETEWISDRALYCLLEKLPRTACVHLQGCFGTLTQEVEHARKVRDPGESAWHLSNESVCAGILWEALAKVTEVSDPARFGRLGAELSQYLESARALNLEKSYKDEYLMDLISAFLRRHGERCKELLRG